ncbi:MAG: hypothetical protein CMG00_07405 [Candidatus Marinimicrobia bacterium]|nr:hypothetical protein [Candidatus Neomarinimicrobiota bacterium]
MIQKIIFRIFIVAVCCLFFSYCSNSKNSKTMYNLDSKKNYNSWKMLSIDEKIGQMIMIRVSGKFYNREDYRYNSIQDLIVNHKIGGLIMYYADIHGAFHNINLFQSWSDSPLIIGSDYERGLGQWMDGGTLFPSNMAVSSTNNPKNSYLQGEIIAKEAKSIGVHMVFAPVLDINNNSKNPIINLRSYGDTPEVVSRYGISFIKGIQSQGVFACGKHFPGHGDTEIDSHSSLPVINVSDDVLYKNEIIPFKKAIQDSIKMIMMGHLVVPSLDSSYKPATHSYKITTEILKNELGFKGVVITDAMEMGALSKNISNGESVVRAIEAGADIILLPIDTKNAIKSIKIALENGRISEDRINQSVEKIWNLKKEAGLFSGKGLPEWERVESLVGSNSHSKVANYIAANSITLVKDDLNSIPLKPEKLKKISHIIMSIDDNAKDYLKSFSKDVYRTFNNVDEVFINYELDNYLIEKIIEKIKDSDFLIVSSLVRIRMDKGVSTIHPSHLRLLKMIKEKINIPNLLVSFGSPYMDSYDYSDAYIATYGYGPISVKAAANAVFGREDISGKLPIDLSKKYTRGTGVYRSKRLSEFKKKDVNKYNLDKAFAVIDSAISNKIFPGAQVFISKDENIVAHKGFGHYTYEDNSILVDTSSVYDIASITKVLSALPLTMKSEQKKKLSMNSYIYEYYPEFKGKYKNKVRIKHLLNHSSGIKGYIEYFNMNHIKDEQDILYDILKRDLIFEPGTDHEYSDLGFILLKNIIELENRSSFSRLSSNWIYKPLNMINTYYMPSQEKIGNIVPTEYDSIYRKKMIKGQVHDENTYLMGGVSAHAGLFSNAWDIAIFTKTFLNDGVWLGRRHFDKLAVKKTITDKDSLNSDFAIGWDTPSKSKSSAGDFFSNYSFGHLGFTGTSVWADKKNKIIVILLTNRVYPTREKKGIYNVRRSFHNEVMKTLLASSEALILE